MTEVAIHTETHSKIGGLLKEAVFGFNDGLVSTFAVIAGLTGGLTENRIVLLAALATLFAGAFSMGLGTYLGSKAEKEHYESERKRELYEMEHVPEIERQEIRDIYTAKGFEGELLERVVEKITSNPKLWLTTMMTEELGFAESPPRPGANGVVMSIAFIIGSLIPTLPYFFAGSTLYSRVPCIGDICPDVEIFIPRLSKMFFASLGLSIIGLFIAGVLKTRFTKRNVFLSAFETLAIGALAAGGSYGIGALFI